MLRLKLSMFVTVLGGLLSLLMIYGLSRHPDIDTGHDYTAVVFSDEGQEIAEFYRERRYFVPYYKIPDHVRKAFIAIEDRRFYSHHGFDMRGILRALRRNIAARATVEGGSTITQQLAKMILKRPERSISRKFRELITTARLEWNYTKDEILGMYLNLAYFGERIYGIESAARAYFDKPVEELSVAEAALLAALQRAPNKYSPLKHPRKAAARRKTVLDEMAALNFISREEYRRAIREPLPQKAHFQRKYGAPYFVESVRQQLARKYGDTVYYSGFHIYSTLDGHMQELAERAVRKGVRTIERRTKPGVQAALVAMDLQDGSIKAMVGGTDFTKTQFNRSTMALRQPGSAFKSFVYAAALEKGISYNDRILDTPISIPDPESGTTWSPRNSEWTYYGYVTLKTAFALSLNAATVRLARDIGFDKVRDTAVQCGIKAELPVHPSLALGSREVTLLELTSAYTVFATGRRVTPLFYTVLTDKSGNVVERVFPSSAEALPKNIVEGMKTLLRAVVTSGTGGRALSVNRPVYGKTGTTDDNADAWFVGFDDHLAVGVWVGRDDHTTIGWMETGSEAALPIWVDFMRSIKY
ncbi:MAG TPA: PBP1A family penicillin-binding protein [Dissulfurispiraceae bacterium]